MLGDHGRDDKRVDLFEFKKALPLLVRCAPSYIFFYAIIWVRALNSLECVEQLFSISKCFRTNIDLQ
jgi:hypothetical protein